MTKEILENEVYKKGLEGFFTKLTEVTDELTTKLFDVAPEAAEALLSLVQFKGFFYLISSSLTMVICYLSIRYLLTKKTEINIASNSYDIFATWGDCFKFWTLAIPVGVLFIISLCSVGNLLSFYNWLSAFHPEGAIAIQALQAVGIDL